ncbi:TonB-dependent receptor [Flavobacterium psychrophilum]|nr:TonB-dependent receptor [Flavobacterium psychrophilum]
MNSYLFSLKQYIVLFRTNKINVFLHSKNLNIKFTILLLLAVVTLYCQGKNSIAGNVKTSDGIPARQIKLVIDDFKIETQSDEKGYYKFDDITLKQELKISLYANGIVVHTETIKVISGHNVVNFTLASKVTELNEVIIKGVGFNRFIGKERGHINFMGIKQKVFPF